MGISVSVIIPAYNRQKYCRAALQILKSQTLKNIEFIIIDDGSTDNTYEYLQQNTKSDARFKIYRLKQNSGPSVARNYALTIAQGEYIGFFDIDDKIPCDYFEKLYKSAHTNCADIVFTAYNNIRHNTTGLVSKTSEKISTLRNGAIWDKLFKSSLISENNIKFLEGAYCADNLFTFIAFYFAKNLFTCNEPVYQYTLQSDSIGRDTQKTQKRKSDILLVAKTITKFVSEHKLDSKSRTEAYYFLQRTFNVYHTDNTFSKKFKKILSAIKPTFSKQHKNNKGSNIMFWIKLGKHLGIISRNRFDRIVLTNKIRKSGLFDEQWYLDKNPDVKRAKVAPIHHYIKHGWKEGRNPSVRFDTNAYLSENYDVANAQICPLVHYIDHGKAEGRPVHAPSGAHIQVNNTQKVYKTIKKSKLFNKKWYLKTYPDVKRAKVDAIEHYIVHGATEGRNPSKYFDTKHYLNTYSDVKVAGMNPLYHYIKYGKGEGRTIRTVSGKIIKPKRTLKQKLKYAWEYPVRVHDEYHRLKDEIKKIKNS